MPSDCVVEGGCRWRGAVAPVAAPWLLCACTAAAVISSISSNDFIAVWLARRAPTHYSTPLRTQTAAAAATVATAVNAVTG